MTTYLVYGRDRCYVAGEPGALLGCGLTMAGAREIVRCSRRHRLYALYDIVRGGQGP